MVLRIYSEGKWDGYEHSQRRHADCMKFYFDGVMARFAISMRLPSTRSSVEGHAVGFR
jgi:hypothetical protein